MIRKCAAGAAAAVIVIGAWGGVAAARDSRAVDALKRQVHLLADGQAGLAYKEIHPAQQKLFTRAQYIECRGRRGSIEVKSIDVKRTYRETVQIPGTNIQANSVAITATIETDNPLQATATETFHEIKARNKWRYTVSNPDECAGE